MLASFLYAVKTIIPFSLSWFVSFSLKHENRKYTKSGYEYVVADFCTWMKLYFLLSLHTA